MLAGRYVFHQAAETSGCDVFQSGVESSQHALMRFGKRQKIKVGHLAVFFR